MLSVNTKEVKALTSLTHFQPEELMVKMEKLETLVNEHMRSHVQKDQEITGYKEEVRGLKERVTQLEKALGFFKKPIPLSSSSSLFREQETSARSILMSPPRGFLSPQMTQRHGPLFEASPEVLLKTRSPSSMELERASDLLSLSSSPSHSSNSNRNSSSPLFSMDAVSEAPKKRELSTSSSSPLKEKQKVKESPQVKKKQKVEENPQLITYWQNAHKANSSKQPNFAYAVEQANFGLALNPQNEFRGWLLFEKAVASNNLALSSNNLKFYGEAQESAAEAIGLEFTTKKKTIGELHYQHSLACSGLGEHSKANKAALTGLELQDRGSNLILWLFNQVSRSYNDSGKYSLAEKTANGGLELSSHNGAQYYLLYNLVRALNGGKKYVEALQTAKEAHALPKIPQHIVKLIKEEEEKARLGLSQ